MAGAPPSRPPPPPPPELDPGTETKGPSRRPNWVIPIGVIGLFWGALGMLQGWRVAATSSVVLPGWIHVGISTALFVFSFLFLRLHPKARSLMILWSFVKLGWMPFYITALERGIIAKRIEAGQSDPPGYNPGFETFLYLFVGALPVFFLMFLLPYKTGRRWAETTSVRK